MTSEKDQVLSNIRACIISSQGGVHVNELDKDYKCLVGETIPYTRLGFSSLQEFLSELPNVQVIQKSGGWWVQAKMDEASSHIQQLVQGQNKSRPRKPKRKARFTPRFSTPSAPRYIPQPTQSHVPHFMQTKTSFKSMPKPRTRYIPPVNTISRNSAMSIENNDWIQKTKPTVVINPKPAPSSGFSPPINPPEPKDTSRLASRPPVDEPSPQSSRSNVEERGPQFRMRSSNNGYSAKGPASTRPALLPTPTQIPGPVLPTPVQTAHRRQPFLLPTPIPLSQPLPYYSAHPQPLASVFHPIQRMPHHLMPLMPPSQNDAAARKKHKPSVSDRLLVYKNKNQTEDTVTEMKESFGEMNLQPPAQNGKSAKPEQTAPPNTVPVKFIYPISYKNKNTPKQGESQPTSHKRYFPESAYDDSSYIIKLSRYAQAQGLPQPEFFLLSQRANKGPGKANYVYLGRVSVTCPSVVSDNSDSEPKSWEFCTFPDEFEECRDALDAAAKLAYEHLIESTAIKLPETKDHAVIFERINQLISGKSQGVWLFQVERQYRLKFNEVLPKNLADLLEQSCPDIVVSNVTEGNYVIIRAKPESSSSLPAKVARGFGKMSLPEDNNWEVFVSKVKSFNELYVRLIGDHASVPYENMCAQMDHYYMNNPGEPPENIHLGSYYVHISNSETFRCFVTGQVNDEYQIYLIDVGDVEFAAATTLRELQPQFYEVPPQALPCHLEGLDNFDFALSNSNPELGNSVLDLMLGRSLASIVHCRDPLRLYLFDTEKEEDVNINDMIKELVVSSFTDPKYAFQEVGSLNTINVPTIDSMGRVFVQKPSWTLDCLNDKFSMISNGVFDVRLIVPEQVSCDKMYYHSNLPTRVKVMFVQNGQVIVNCVDTGGEMKMDIQDIFEVPHLDEILPHIPPQAIQVLMHDIGDGTLNPAQAKGCLQIINTCNDEPTIGKVIAHVNGMPVMELFVRNQENRLLSSLNQSIIMCEVLDSEAADDDDASSVFGNSSVVSASTSFSKADSTFSRLGTTISRHSLDTSIGRLGTSSKSEDVFNKGPVNFKIDDEVQIYVTRIATPGNFTVIPANYLKFLNNLISEMNVYYTTKKTSPDVPYSPQLGECVAGYSKGRWFRVLIDKKLDSDCFSGRFLDQGHLEMFPCKALRELPDRFKKLPYLAFKGQLHGVHPINGKDWEVDDCIRLKELIHGKKLWATVRDIVSDDDGKTLSLEIIDTSTDTDIYVARQMVLEDRAVTY